MPRREIVRPLAPTWGGVLAIDDDPHTVQIPEGFVMKEGFVSKDGFWSQEASDAVARAQVTPEMLAQLDPSLRQMLARIGREVRDSEDPFKSWLMSRAATLLSYLGVPQTVVLRVYSDVRRRGRCSGGTFPSGSGTRGFGHIAPHSRGSRSSGWRGLLSENSATLRAAKEFKR